MFQAYTKNWNESPDMVLITKKMLDVCVIPQFLDCTEQGYRVNEFMATTVEGCQKIIYDNLGAMGISVPQKCHGDMIVVC